MINEVTETNSLIKTLIIQTTTCKRNIKSTPFYSVGILQTQNSMIILIPILKQGLNKEEAGEGSNREMRSFREDLNTKKWVRYEGTPDFRAKIPAPWLCISNSLR
jgi:hypothetical protein